ncbi:ATP-binding protein [Janibacter sp. GXQ6167]|uniref:sensor histidine kinase n=1 Tax=Janibacter sp. GXQ6167 TaxID=3240791 RepID=UPI003523E383
MSPDGSERLHPLEAAQLPQDMIQQATTMLPDGLVAVGPNLAVEMVNLRAEQILGMKAEDLVGHPTSEVFDLRDSAGREYWKELDPWRALTIVSGHRELLLLAPNGRQILVTARYLRAGPKRSVQGVLLGLRGAEQRLRAEADQAALISTVAHELRAPLSGVHGFSSAMLRHWDELTDSQKQLMVRTIETDAGRVTRLITELLEVARIDSGRQQAHPLPIPASEAIEGTIRRIEATGFDLSAITVSIAPDAEVLHADPDGLDRILTNLLDNAVRHGDPPIEISVTRDESHHVIRVADHGPGIPEAMWHMAFARFWRGGRGGTGLGLYVVKGLAEAHNGTVEIGSSAGGGALLTVSLPVQSG